MLKPGVCWATAGTAAEYSVLTMTGGPARITAAITAVLVVTACGGDSARIDELEAELEELRTSTTQPTTTTIATTTTQPTTTTSTIPELSPAQAQYCADLLTEIAVPTATGGRTARPETIQFFELAHRMGYLQLPYNAANWGQAVAETPTEFVSLTHLFAGAMSLNVGEAMILEWANNLIEVGITDAGSIYEEVCLQAWELR